jgi:hypothetical protein
MIPAMTTPMMLSASFPTAANMLLKAADHTQLQLYNARPIDVMRTSTQSHVLKPVARWRLGVLFAANAFNNVRFSKPENNPVTSAILGIGAGLFAGIAGLTAGQRLVNHAHQIHENTLFYNHKD